MKIRQKLSYSFLAVALITFVSGGISISNAWKIDGRIRAVLYGEITELNRISALENSVENIELHVINLIHEEGEEDVNVYNRWKEELLEECRKTKDAEISMMYAVKGSISLQTVEEGHGELEELELLQDANIDGMLAAVGKVLKLLNEKREAAAEEIFHDELRPMLKKAREIILQLEADTEDEILMRMKQVERLSSQTVLFGILASVVAFFAAISLGWWISNSITNPLDLLKENVARIAAGELQQATGVKSEDEIGALAQEIEKMAVVLRQHEVFQEKAKGELTEYAMRFRKSNLELQELLFVASHDLQEPLRKAMTLGELFLMRFSGQVDQEAVNLLERIKSTTLRLHKLAEDMRSFANVSGMNLKFEKLDLNDLVLTEIKGFQELLDHLGGEIVVEQLPVIEADQPQMKILFHNLIDNSLKFCKNDISPRIRLYVEAGEESREYCRIVVEDNGIGFDERHLSRIFGVFQQLKKSEHASGTGMGLALCRKIVERHGGRIMAQSKEGEGTRISLILPIKIVGDVMV